MSTWHQSSTKNTGRRKFSFSLRWTHKRNYCTRKWKLIRWCRCHKNAHDKRRNRIFQYLLDVDMQLILASHYQRRKKRGTERVTSTSMQTELFGKPVSWRKIGKISGSNLLSLGKKRKSRIHHTQHTKQQMHKEAYFLTIWCRGVKITQ